MESILPLALHSIKTLLCTARNATPHERFFAFARRSIFGEKQLPTWLCEEGPVLWRNFNRKSKNDPIAKEVTLINSNPNYALISDDRGVRNTVALRDLAPLRNTLEVQDESRREYPTIEKSLPQDFVADGKLKKEPHVSLRRMQIPRDFVVENKREGDSRNNGTFHTRFGRRIQFPKKYAEDFEVEN